MLCTFPQFNSHISKRSNTFKCNFMVYLFNKYFAQFLLQPNVWTSNIFTVMLFHIVQNWMRVFSFFSVFFLINLCGCAQYQIIIFIIIIIITKMNPTVLSFYITIPLHMSINNIYVYVCVYYRYFIKFSNNVRVPQRRSGIGFKKHRTQLFAGMVCCWPVSSIALWSSVCQWPV